MSVYKISGDHEQPNSISIRELILAGSHELASQLVFKKGRLVNEVFDYSKSHFSVSENEDVFRRYEGPDYFKFDILRRMCGLVDKDVGQVKSLTSGFKISSQGNAIETKLSLDGSQPKTMELALLLYWLSGGSDTFEIDDSKEQIVHDFFGVEICADALNNENTEYKIIRCLLKGEGNKVTITR